ncbi:hypothetical protein [Blastococcus jejuensis]|uniref:hypothetical protein n=1 Tax=Blastococcus jejuensis TaxID=351224 RepID=UPI0031D27D04
MTARRPYLLDVVDALWPSGPSARIHRGQTVREATTFVAVPTAGAPRLLLPAGGALAAGAVRAYGGHASRTARWRMRGTGALFALGVGGLLFRDRVTVGGDSESVLDELARVLDEPVHVALRAGPPRANRKPVLAVLDEGGRPLAFAKVGLTPLTADLLAVEASALTGVAGKASDLVRVPRLLHHGTWRDMAILVQEALPVDRSGAVSDALLVRAVGEIASVQGTAMTPWAGSQHAEHIRGRLARMARTPEAAMLAEAVERLNASREALPVGCWHGDWTPWNCASLDGSVLLWDWERFDTGVPIGFDLLHHDLQSVLATDCSPARPAALLATVASRLSPLGLTPGQATLTGVAYLVELASRYLADDQAAAGASVGDVGRWLLPVLTRAVRDLPAPRGEMTS